ncbi:serine dehydratase subunit alpha family protein [Clostridium sp.]|uniref:L-cysteine desulfidase family protein n=1 Tax=Clostridium sp. TaxID=1506 RepID=UPI001A488AA4|nr:L-serine ammonia-lyase, iron-sulfur-dependent, subunit alpha [Clostridium sp.]MBK5239894.1 serine dehydratase subunit alpha family protein [Clostridium sp.]
MDFNKIVDVLRNQVKPALGCTEPVAVAIAVSKAYKQIGGEVKSIEVKISPNIYKNGMRVGIPGTTEKGITFVAALAVVCGEPESEFEVLKNVNDIFIATAKRIVGDNKVKIKIEENKGKFFIEAVVISDRGEAKCIIKDSHTNIVYVEKNSLVVFEKNETIQNVDLGKIGNLTIKELRNFIETVPFENIEFLLEGVKLNMKMAEIGLKNKSGAGLGSGIKDLMDSGILDKGILNEVRSATAAAADARMAGVNRPVMSSAGSGNHGITAIIPPCIICRHLGYDDEKLARALAFSHLITIYIKEYTGKLSPICGCSVAAGIGACVSVAWLIGCNDIQIVGAIKNMVGNITGMVCDGAKGGCAFKLSTASSEAILQAELAKNNTIISDFDGIVGNDAETSIKNLGELCMKGMGDIDGQIIEIMVEEQPSVVDYYII